MSRWPRRWAARFCQPRGATSSAVTHHAYRVRSGSLAGAFPYRSSNLWPGWSVQPWPGVWRKHPCPQFRKSAGAQAAQKTCKRSERPKGPSQKSCDIGMVLSLRPQKTWAAKCTLWRTGLSRFSLSMTGGRNEGGHLVCPTSRSPRPAVHVRTGAWVVSKSEVLKTTRRLHVEYPNWRYLQVCQHSAAASLEKVSVLSSIQFTCLQLKFVGVAVGSSALGVGAMQKWAQRRSSRQSFGMA